MSLRDQLLAKGIASKKDAKRSDRAQKQKRKKKHGQKRKKSVVEREAVTESKAAFEAHLVRRAAGRKLRENEREEYERAFRVRRIVLDAQIRGRGPIRFHFKKIDGRRIDFLSVSKAVAFKLRVGEAAIAAVLGEQEAPESYHLIPAKQARALLTLNQKLLVFFVEDTEGIGAPEEDFLEPDWEIALGPHRLR